MKNLLISILALNLLTACGGFGTNWYTDLDNVNDDQNDRIDELERAIKELRNSLSLLQSTVSSLTTYASSLQAQIDTLTTQSSHHSAEITQLQANQAQAEEAIDTLEAQVAQIQAQLAALETQENIVEFVDPCGDAPGSFDEVLLRTSSGKLIAYFEQGGNRFLSILTPGSYRTTDAQRCNFTVNGAGVVTW